MHVGVNDQAQLARGEAAGLLGTTVIESNSPAETLHGSQAGQLRLFRFANLFVQRITVSKSDKDGVVILVSHQLGFLAVVHTFRCQKRCLTDLELPAALHHVANSGGIGDGRNHELGYVRIAAILNPFRYDAVRRSFHDRELHAFLQVRVAAGVDVHRTFAYILHSEHRRLVGGLRGGFAWSKYRPFRCLGTSRI